MSSRDAVRRAIKDSRRLRKESKELRAEIKRLESVHKIDGVKQKLKENHGEFKKLVEKLLSGGEPEEDNQESPEQA